jgi:hypothetical protein
MFYVLIFAGIAILLVVAYFVQQGRQRGEAEAPQPSGTTGASRTSKGSAARRERKRRRAQSSHDRRKRH